MPSRRQRVARNGHQVAFAFIPEGYRTPLIKLEQRVYPSSTINGIVASLQRQEILFAGWEALCAACPCHAMDIPVDESIPPEACCTIEVIMSCEEPESSESETEAPPTEAPEPDAEASASEDEQVNLGALL
jgi:hypothetical protein